MDKSKRLKRIALWGASFPLLFMSLSGNQAYAMKSVDDYDKTLLMQLDFNQNDFSENITNKTFTPTAQTGSFVEGIRYNSYAFSDENLVVPLKDIKADTENVLTVSLWWYPENMKGLQEIFTIGDNRFHYNTELKAFELFGDDGRVIQRFSKPMTGNKWMHMSLTLNRQNAGQNLLSIDGNGIPATLVTSGVNPSWGELSQLVLNGGDNQMSPGSRLDEVEIRKGSVGVEDSEDLARLAFVPDLYGENVNGNPHLSWSSDIMPEDVIVESSLEDGQMIPRMIWGSGDYGGQELVSTGAYSGEKAIKVTDTYANGNHYGYPATSSNKSISMWNRMYLPNGIDLSVTYYVKSGDQNAVIAQNGDGGWGTTFSNYPVIRATAPITKGDRILQVDSIGSYAPGRHIMFDEDPAVIGSYYTVESVDAVQKTITLRSGVNQSYPVGKEMRNRPWRGAFSFGSRTVAASDDWQRISQNTKVYNYADYNVLERGASFYTNFTTKGILHFDNVKLGYATKVKLFRGNTLLYEGLLSDYRDTASKDKVAPTMVTPTKINRTREKVEVSFEPATDSGTTYGYRIQSIANNGNATPLSKEVNVEAISGIKGYSYVLDNAPYTIPNNTVNSTDTAISISATDSFQRYLHIKAIDNAGNTGETKHIKISTPQLTVTPDDAGTFANLEWSMELVNEQYDYKVYKRRKGETEFQSISTFGQQNGEPLKVLNIYPIQAGTTTFTDWKGTRKTIPLSASIERWMEEPNAENPKGYGKGLIDVDIVPITSFNTNPDTYLKNSDGSWKYDVVFEGAWDGNGFNAENDYSTKAVDSLKSWIDDGQGYLAGHDTIMYSAVWNTNANLLRDRLNIKVRTLDAEANGVGSTGAMSGQVNVRLDKQGLLTSYPWEIGELGSPLTVPASHGSGQIAYGDVWMSYEKFSGRMTDVNGNGKANYYLTSWNNTAMIQTGHSNGQATPDEQKVLANTLFYLSQKTSETKLTDYSSVDDAKPNKVTSLSFNRIDTGVYDISFPTVTDNGITYEYYVEAIGKETGSSFYSAIQEAYIESGLKGYRVDVTTDSTIPLNTTVMSPTSPVRVTVPASSMAEEPEFYLHVKAIDEAENFSTYTKRVDSATAYLIVTPSESNWTNQDVVLHVKGSEALGKITELRLPDGTILKSPTATYTVSQNGNYPFYGRDEFGQWISGGWTVQNIDRENPVISIPNLSDAWDAKDILIDIQAK